MSFGFVSHVPVWVWFLLAALIALGLASTVTRRRTLPASLAMPVGMTALSLGSVFSAFSGNAAALVAWAIGLLLALSLRVALQAWGRLSWDAAARRVIVPGSWLPLACIVAIFALKFTGAVLMAMHPELAHRASFVVLLCGVYGAFSGLFLGRVLAIWRAVRGAVSMPTRTGKRLALVKSATE